MARETASRLVHSDLGITHFHAVYHRHVFPPHSHDDYLIGMTTAGAEHFEQEGTRHVSLPGMLRTINVDAVHSGGCANGQSWGYEALFVSAPLMHEVCERKGNGDSLPQLLGPAIDDARLRDAAVQLFSLLRTSDDSLLRSSALAGFLQLVWQRLGAGSAERAAPMESAPVRRARDYLAENACEKVLLSELAAVAGISRFHLLRQFKEQRGMTPWQFQMQERMRRARHLLGRGVPLSIVAADCGFSDQSHFTHRFRQRTGMTPASYAASIVTRIAMP